MTAASLCAALPFAVEPGGHASFEALLETVEEQGPRLQRELLAHGALLFRGWAIDDVADLGRFAAAFSGGAPPFAYAGGASPRKALGEGSYTSTEYPPSLELALHNELSYSDIYPSRLFFLCIAAPEQGGETSLGDSRRILARIDPEVADRFRRRQLLYIRNLSSLKGSGYSWQDALETEDREEAEARCRRMGADHEWRGDLLHLRQRRPATAVHPVSGEEVWFNQADGFHPSALDPRTYAEQIALCGSEDQFRLNVTYGDGTPIEREALDEVRAAVRAERVLHRWRQGDLVVIDNLLAAHGRMPFSGPRKIALAMV